MSAKKQTPLDANLIDEAIEWHDGDLRATIATLIEDCSYLRDQLDTARHCMSNGYTRGWKPIADR
ncbi:hypothetical protein [Rhizobium leguminosarum]|uniref:hypothetical protein n=1 Tax=Rhizobium leguminosarum TaxID=384 RepID=UPI0010301583|nr:hypothetical protein [Rhizobium leguminosarum]TAV74736.1 hypothetical protein ELI28_14910 [Rhizobium leguminosarum]TAV79335.1 hypothetical protein ELI27_14900 [Rhizobium leguminosarum]